MSSFGSAGIYHTLQQLFSIEFLLFVGTSINVFSVSGQ
jgi:hypothetical protein